MQNQQKIALEMSSRPYFLSSQSRPRRLLQNQDTLYQHFQIVLSIVGAVSLLLLAAFLRDGMLKAGYLSMACFAAFSMLIIYEWHGIYRIYRGNVMQRLLLSWCVVVSLVIAMTFFTKNSDHISRVVILSWAISGFVFQVLSYKLAHSISRYICGTHSKPIRAIVIGSGKVSEHLVSSINDNAWIPDQIVGVVHDEKSGSKDASQASMMHLGKLDETMEVVSNHNINRVYLALPMRSGSVIERIYRDLSQCTVDVIWVPDVYDMDLMNHSVKEINGLPLISLSESPMMSEVRRVRKSLLDKVVGMLCIVLLSPVMLTVAILVKCTSTGPVFFKQKRHGLGGREIEVWKFRSMYVHDGSKVQQASKNDSRITPVGRIIRRTSLDELPQLFNVVDGSMSLVGPRPHAIEHNDFYSQYIRSYMRRHSTKPGMTGLAQIHGLRGETETLNKMLARVEKDLEYINTWSVWLDIKILIKTPLSLFSKNAY